MNTSHLQSYETLLFRSRISIMMLLLVLAFSLLILRLWYLQVLKGEQYADFSKGNRIRIVAQGGPRGVIYDRNQVAIADNRPSYQLQLIREDTPDVDLSLNRVSEVLGFPYLSLKKKVIENRYRLRFRPIVLAADIDDHKAALIETFQDDFPGISTVVQSRRFYPFHQVASHVLGYVGLGSDLQQTKLPKSKKNSSRIYGRSGMEKLYNDILTGTDGGRQVEVDHLGRELKVLSNPVDPIPGRDLHLSIDIELQQTIYDAMRGKTGTVIVMKPKTGEVLAMGSYPSYNPNLFAAGINYQQWNRLLSMEEHPLENRAFQGQYPPGSIYKLLTAYAGLQEEVVDQETKVTCDGYYYLKGRKRPYKCWKWKEGGHGEINLEEAIKGSCNIFFYHIGMEVGIDSLYKYARKFGFGKPTGANLSMERSGLIPNTQWKQRSLGERWYLGETPPASIGQGYVLVTPIQAINFINIIANAGKLMTPRLVRHVDEHMLPKDLGLSEKHLRLIRRGMASAVGEEGGTAGVVKSAKWNVGAKTATAQVVGHRTLDALEESEREHRAYKPHSWFIAMAPVEDPEVSVVVLVEHGGSGSKAAGPIANMILDYYQEHYVVKKRLKPEFSAFREQLQKAFKEI